MEVVFGCLFKDWKKIPRPTPDPRNVCGDLKIARKVFYKNNTIRLVPKGAAVDRPQDFSRCQYYFSRASIMDICSDTRFNRIVYYNNDKQGFAKRGDVVENLDSVFGCSVAHTVLTIGRKTYKIINCNDHSSRRAFIYQNHTYLYRAGEAVIDDSEIEMCLLPEYSIPIDVRQCNDMNYFKFEFYRKSLLKKNVAVQPMEDVFGCYLLIMQQSFDNSGKGKWFSAYGK